MIQYKTGNLLNDSAEALINTVNTVGVMGKGIALQFKQAYPQMFQEYVKAYKESKLEIGKMHIYQSDELVGPKYIINFPTKQHWRAPSKIEFIEKGLVDLVKVLDELNIGSIAIPPLGCGNGGLEWKQVQPLIVNAFKDKDIIVNLYNAQEAPPVEEMIIRTAPPKMTKGRALLLALMESYAKPGYKLTLLEIQKLAYFLQEQGEPLKLRFEKYMYGPYADNLNHVLQRMDGHFIRGYGDRSREAEVIVMDGSLSKARDFLRDHPSALNHLEKVNSLIRGFETPYGMELLSTVHWIMKENPNLANDFDYVYQEVVSWNERKKNLFSEEHVRKTWHYLLKEANHSLQN